MGKVFPIFRAVELADFEGTNRYDGIRTGEAGKIVLGFGKPEDTKVNKVDARKKKLVCPILDLEPGTFR